MGAGGDKQGRGEEGGASVHSEPGFPVKIQSGSKLRGVRQF